MSHTPSPPDPASIPLTRKEERFVVEWLVDCNATAAARRAGYKDGPGLAVTASRLLRKANVARALDERRRTTLSARILTGDEVAAALSRIAFADPATAVDQQGNLLPLHLMPADTRQAISGLKLTKRNVVAGDGAQEDVVELKWWDKVKALELLGKRAGIFTDVVKHTADGALLEALAEGRRRIAERHPRHPGGSNESRDE